MRVSGLLACRMVVTGGLLCVAGTGGCASVQWVHAPFAEVRRQALARRQPIFVYVMDTWSEDRTRMELEVFSNPQVIAALRDTVNKPAKYDWIDIDPELAKAVTVRAPQVCLVLDPSGREVDRLIANPIPTPARFVGWLNDAKARATPPPPSRPAGTGP